MPLRRGVERADGGGLARPRRRPGRRPCSTASSLLRRRAAGGDGTQLLAANVDLVLLVCGLDRPVAAGRIQRGEALAWDAGATPVLVLTKADLADGPRRGARRGRRATTRASRCHVTSVATGAGIDELRRAARRRHLGAARGVGGREVEPRQRAARHARPPPSARCATGDAKGRHTTTNRQLHLLAGGGVLIDSPGIREVGLAGDEESVDATFADIDDLADDVPLHRLRARGRAGLRGGAGGGGRRARAGAARRLRRTCAARRPSAARRADEHERRAYERRFTKAVKAHVKNKPNNRP